VDVCLVIKLRLEELGLEQRDLATDIYEKMAKFLKLPSDRLSKLAELGRRESL
jgi:hypothetical protein